MEHTMGLFEAVDHIGIATRAIDDALPLYVDLFGMQVVLRETVGNQGTDVAMLHCGTGAVELLAPARADSPVAAFLQERGEGMHHLAYRVADLPQTLARCRAAGLQLVDQEPRMGAGGHRVAFLHPRSTGHVLIELVEHRP